jgi:hypothetical protein
VIYFSLGKDKLCFPALNMIKGCFPVWSVRVVEAGMLFLVEFDTLLWRNLFKGMEWGFQ